MATPEGTSILKIITEYCEAYIDDIRISSMRTIAPALYFRNMWFYLRVAISLFNHPVEMQKYLNDGLNEPTFASATYTLPSPIEGEGVLPLGATYAGYELASCRERVVEPSGVVSYYQVDFTYDAQIGNVTVNGNYPTGTTFELDFASDGSFARTITPEMADILATGCGLTWRERFNADWLTMVSKTEDKSFKEQNRATDKRANVEQIEKMRISFAGKMRKFETSQYYKNTVTQGNINIIA